MPDPIIVTVTATPDPIHEDLLQVSVDLPTVFLSLEDADEVQWVCSTGTVEVNFAPAKNPFDANGNTGGQYQAGVNGSIVSGPLSPNQIDSNAEVFRTFKYSILVKSLDGKRAGSLDPHVKGRGRSVYARSA